jgi:hypothetical protein
LLINQDVFNTSGATTLYFCLVAAFLQPGKISFDLASRLASVPSVYLARSSHFATLLTEQSWWVSHMTTCAFSSYDLGASAGIGIFTKGWSNRQYSQYQCKEVFMNASRQSLARQVHPPFLERYSHALEHHSSA